MVVLPVCIFLCQDLSTVGSKMLCCLKWLQDVPQFHSSMLEYLYSETLPSSSDKNWFDLHCGSSFVHVLCSQQGVILVQQVGFVRHESVWTLVVLASSHHLAMLRIQDSWSQFLVSSSKHVYSTPLVSSCLLSLRIFGKSSMLISYVQINQYFQQLVWYFNSEVFLID